MANCKLFCLVSAIVASLIICACLLYYFMMGSDGKSMKLIIDTDAGGDDAVALLLALASPEVQVLAITCTYGNTNENNVERNVLKILTVAGRTDIPVYGGAEYPLLQNYVASTYFGNDGLGDFEFGREISTSIDQSKHASIAMIDLVKQHAGDISILTLGPLTNVALAASLYPKFTENVKKFYVMGAFVNESDTKDPQIEFNFSLDPESNEIFLKSTVKERSVVAPWDVVLKNNISKEWRTETFGKRDSEKVKFLNQAESVVLNNQTDPDWLPADAIAVATMVQPNLITKSLTARMSSVTCGSQKGLVITDANSAKSNVEIVRDFDVNGFKEMLLMRLAQ